MFTCRATSILTAVTLTLGYSAVIAQEKDCAQPQKLIDVGSGLAFTPSTFGFVGKLFFKWPDNSDHHCTAAFIDGAVLVTAAHCVQEPGSTVMYTINRFTLENGTNFYVKPACTSVHSMWKENLDKFNRIAYDYAFLQTTTNVSGNPKDIYTGGNSYGTLITTYGYPGVSDPLASVTTITQQDILHPIINAFKTTDITFTQGTSGGPWVMQSSNKILSVNSSFSPGVYDPSYMRVYGPIFDNDAKALRDATANCP
jgi:hypothetical protein